MKNTIKSFIKKYLCPIKYKNYQRYCTKNKQKEFLIFNAPIHGNIGDHAIVYAEKEILKKKDLKAFEIPTFNEKYYFEYIKNNISPEAIIAITGGGFIGSQWSEEQKLVNKVIKEFSNHKIIIFPSTIYFKDDEYGNEELEKSIKVFNEAKDLTIFAREEKTYKLAKEIYTNTNIILVPDIVLSLEYNNMKFKRDGILVCLRKDVEGLFSKNEKEKLYNLLNEKNLNVKRIDTVVNYAVKQWNREKKIKKYLKKFAKSRLVITDRLHGMVFATITNTPCIVFSNYNYKVEGVYQWIKNVDKNIIFEKNIDNISKDIEDLLKGNIDNQKEKKYDFTKLHQLLEEKINIPSNNIKK